MGEPSAISKVMVSGLKTGARWRSMTASTACFVVAEVVRGPLVTLSAPSVYMAVALKNCATSAMRSGATKLLGV